MIGQRATSASKGWHLGGSRRLENQHQRNLPATVTAANLPLFESARCVVDIGGGTGTLALALRELHPDMRIVITDLPDSMHGIKQILDRFDAGGIELCPMDVTEKNWDIPDCDVIFLGNLLHVFGDRITRHVIEHAGRHLRRSGGGSLVIHEVLWDDERSGPLKAALFDFTMRGFGGKQRTAKEFKSMMSDAGFSDFVATPTRSEFVALAGRINA